jgi:hypothetical protein
LELPIEGEVFRGGQLVLFDAALGGGLCFGMWSPEPTSQPQAIHARKWNDREMMMPMRIF